MREGSYHLNGITFNVITESPAPFGKAGYLIETVSGLFGDNEPKFSSQDIPNWHGALTYPSYMRESIITIEGKILAFDQADLNNRIVRLCRAGTILSRPVTMKFSINGLPPLQVKVKAKVTPQIEELAPTMASFQMQLVAPDPFIYSQTLHESTARYYRKRQGTLLPTITPIIIDESHTNPYGALKQNTSNAGTISAWPIIYIYGRVQSPRVVNKTTGREFRVKEFIGSRDTLVIDCLNRTVRRGGGNLYYKFAGTFFSLTPGDNIIFLKGDNKNNRTKIKVVWRDTYV